MAILTRRTFLISGGVLGGGLLLGYAFTPNRYALTASSSKDAQWLTTWVSIHPDNTVTILVPHAEMGQGAHTSLPMMLAEELEADWSMVKMEQAPAESIYAVGKVIQGFVAGEINPPESLQRLVDYSFYKIADIVNMQITGGSASVRFTGHWGMRHAGAAAKEMLLKAAADTWEVPVGECNAKLGHVHHAASGQTLTFGELADRASTYTPSVRPKLKDKKDYTICGKSIPHFNVPEIVKGEMMYGIDVSLPEMKYAAIRHAPVFGGDVVSFDADAIKDNRGVEKVLKIPGAVVVIADNYWRAKTALNQLPVEFDAGEHQDFNTTRMFEDLGKILDSGKAEIDQSIGKPSQVIEDAGALIEAEYQVPFLAHATMEPMNCTAHFHGGHLDIWTGTQDLLGTRAFAAEISGLDFEQVTAHPIQLGGGFGRRIPGTGNFIEDAVHVAMAVPYPVNLIWSREEDMQHDYYRPAGRTRFKASLDNEGKPELWMHHYTDIGINDDVKAAFIPYAVPNQEIGRIAHETPVPVSYWRSVEHSYQGFFIESFIDELAYQANTDPFKYRLDLLNEQPRYRAVLELAAEKIGWDNAAQMGAGKGIAIKESFGTIVAQAAEVSLDKNGQLKIHKIVAVADPGEVIHPENARAQIESGIIYALSALLFGEITLENGRVMQNNFPDYQVVRLANTPQMEVYFIESGETVGGMGEVGTPPLAPAICNAIFAATGKRIRRLPLMNQALKDIS